MKAAPFTYHRPGSLDDAVDLLGSLGTEVKVISGGQSLVPLMNLRAVRPEHLVDVGALDALRGVSRRDDGTIVIGALTTYREVELSETIAAACPVLAEAARWIGHEPIRTRGTVGGNLAHADPAAELPAIMVLLDAEIVAVSSRGTRVVPATAFLLSFFTTALEPDEILTEIRIPPPASDSGWGFAEVSRRPGDLALVGAAALVERETDGEEQRIGSARVVTFGVSPTPTRAIAAEALAAGRQPGSQLWNEMAAAAVSDLEPFGDLHASAAYRAHVARALVARVLAEAVGRWPS